MELVRQWRWVNRCFPNRPLNIIITLQGGCWAFVCGMCVWALGLYMPFSPQAEPFAIGWGWKGDVAICIHVWCVHAYMHMWLHNICRCEEVSYLYQLLLVITHWCSRAVQTGLGPATFHCSTEKRSLDEFKNQKCSCSCPPPPISYPHILSFQSSSLLL